VTYLLVFLGGGLGSALRLGVNQLSEALMGPRLPWGTFVVNVLGSFVMGVIVSYLALHGELSANYRSFIATGIVGGFTTFSAFTLETLLLWQRGENATAAIYAAASVAVSLLALAAGLALGRAS
jgi:CrcB protein